MNRTPTLLDVCRFLRRQHPGFCQLPTPQGLAKYAAWYWRDARAGVIHDGGQIIAVALARCVHDAAQGATPFVHDETAPIVWVDEIVSLHPHGIAYLLGHAISRFGPRREFAGHVFSRDGELRMLPFRTVQRLAA